MGQQHESSERLEEKKGRKKKELTSRVDEARVVLLGQERVGKLPEEQLQQAGNTIDVVEEVLRVPEIHGARVCEQSLAKHS